MCRYCRRELKACIEGCRYGERAKFPFHGWLLCGFFSVFSFCVCIFLFASLEWCAYYMLISSLVLSLSLSLQGLSAGAVQPLLTFPASSFQYVTSVQWSPQHPGVFAATASGAISQGHHNHAESVINHIPQRRSSSTKVLFIDINVTLHISLNFLHLHCLGVDEIHMTGGTLMLWNICQSVVEPVGVSDW